MLSICFVCYKIFLDGSSNMVIFRYRFWGIRKSRAWNVNLMTGFSKLSLLSSNMQDFRLKRTLFNLIVRFSAVKIDSEFLRASISLNFKHSLELEAETHAVEEGSLYALLGIPTSMHVGWWVSNWVRSK